MKFPILILAFFISVNLFSYAQDSIPTVVKTYPIDSLNNIIIRSLESKKIVLLGESVHGHRYYMGMVIKVLNSWLDQLEKSPDYKTVPTKLFLFLEKDSVEQAIFNKSVRTGNLSEYINLCDNLFILYGDLGTVDRLKYIMDLKDIENRIQKINKKMVSGEIELRIIGAEAQPPFEYPDMVKMGWEHWSAKKFEWFAKERDKLSSGNIIRLMNSNKDFKAIVYYGSAHLIRKLYNKATIEPGRPASWEYYMAHYLDEYFGRNQVITFFPDGRPGDYLEENRFDNLNPDYSFYCNITPYNSFPLYLINTKPSLNSLVQVMDSSFNNKDLTYHYLWRKCAGTLLYHIKRSYLYSDTLNKKIIDSITFIRSHNRDSMYVFTNLRRIFTELINKFDVVRNLQDMNKWILREKVPDSMNYQYYLKNLVYNLPKDTVPLVYFSEIFNSENRNYLDTFEINEILDRIEELKIYYAINLLWVSSMEEKTGLIEYLQNSTGKNYNSAKEWDTWWHSNLTQKYRVTINVSSENLNDTCTVCIAGNNFSLGSWDPGKIKMDKVSKNKWTGTFLISDWTDLAFKFTLGSWDSECLDSDNKVIPYFKYTIDKDQEINIHIHNWKNRVN